MHCETDTMNEPEFCRYTAEVMLPLLMQLEQELAGVTSSDDIEYVHRARVATRRIRACLTNFSCVFANSSVKKWKQDFRQITRALGEARDLDVQIEFIQSYFLKKIQDNVQEKVLFYPDSEKKTHIAHPVLLSGKTVSLTHLEKSRDSHVLLYVSSQDSQKKTDEKDENSVHFSPASFLRPGLECLLLRLMQRRQEIQPEVLKVIKKFERDRVTESMRTYLYELKIRAELQGTERKTPFSYQQAFFHIKTALSELFSYEPWLSDPLMIHRHHEMRIAAKKLRYTLESFSYLYECRLKDEIKTFKALQEILGEMHDCDVWIARLPEFCNAESQVSSQFFGNHAFFSLLKPGLAELLAGRRTKRADLFLNLHEMWFSLKKEKFWDNLEEKITAPLLCSYPNERDTQDDRQICIALISDVHANLPALEAVLADAKERGVTAVCNAGDSVGYGAFPDEVVTLLRRAYVLSVIGNYDRSVLTKKWKRKRLSSRDKQIAMRFAYENLSRENRDFLKSLPESMKLHVKDLVLYITHGSPDSMTEYLVEDTPYSRFSDIAAKAGADIIVTGHTHLPSIKQIDGVWFVNCGSVGRTEDGDPRACYALLSVHPLSITHIRVPYDISRAIDAIHERHLPDSLARVISDSKPLNLLSEQEDPDEK